MKSMTKLMVVAMLLVAALVVAPAAARPVVSGDTVFIGEKDVNLNKVFNGSTAEIAGAGGVLVYYSSVTGGAADRTGTIQKSIPVNNPDTFELTATDFGSLTGQWYAFNKSGTPNYAVLGDAFGSILVQKPTVNLDVKLAGSTDSVNGKTVTRSSNISFELEHNLGVEGTPFEIDIEVTTPSGGKLTTFGNNSVNLKGLPLSGQKYKTDDSKGPYPLGIDLEGREAGTYTAIAKWPSSSDFYDKGYNSNTVTFEVLTKKVAISSNKDSVVRGNNFVVTITGESKTDYYVFIKDASIKANEYPLILEGQPGVTTENVDSISGAANYLGTKAKVNTKADGTRTIEFNTTTNTDDRQYTIRVEEITTTPGKASTYDDVKVRVEEGDVTITASGTGVYYLGEEITLSGTCTDNKDYVYLFLTGPNLATRGVKLEGTMDPVENGTHTGFTFEKVEADDTWSFKWNTADITRSLDAGGYTIYAVSLPRDKDALSQAKYATAAVQLKTGFLTATSSGAKIAKGDDLKITGTAMGDPNNVYVWIFGKNRQVLGESATVEADGSFEYELKGGETKDWSAGQYFAVVQHPMMDGEQGIYADKDERIIYGIDGSGVAEKGINIGRLQASDAANALIQALDSPNIDDTYVKLTFDFEEAYIFIDPIGDKEAGSKFTITGTTNVAVGDKLIIDVTSAAFGPTTKTEASGFGASSGNVVVEKGDGANKWSFEVDAADLKPDQYIVKVECIETDTTATANFNMVEADETTPTTVTTTAPAVETTTTAPAGETTTEPTPTPGFGALVALAGLGAVAFLVLRRK